MRTSCCLTLHRHHQPALFEILRSLYFIRPKGFIRLVVSALLVHLIFAHTDAVAGEDALILPTMTVTADRIDNDPQKTPISVIPLQGDELERSSVEYTEDLQFRTTGLNYNATVGQPYIRGIGTEILSIGADSPIAIYVDDVYQTRMLAGRAHFLYDMDRVELIKGPQGALYGRNATGGMLKLMSREPEPKPSAQLGLHYGNFEFQKATAVINTPLVKERVYLRISGLRVTRDGFTRIVNQGTTIDDEDAYGLRGQLLIFPSHTVELLYRFSIDRDRGSHGLQGKVNPNLPAPQVDTFGGQNPVDPREVFHSDLAKGDHEIKGTSQRLTWERARLTLKSLTAYRKTTGFTKTDSDNTDIDFLVFTSPEESKTFTQEFQLSSNHRSGIEWLTGLFYLNEKAEQGLDAVMAQLGLRFLKFSENETDNVALFGQARIPLNINWALTLGGRYSREEKKHFLSAGIGGPFINGGKKDWDAFMPKVVIDFSPNETVFSYLSASRGFKSGGFNSTNVGEQFDPETIWSYEAGIKTNLYQGRLQLNAAAFYYDYTNLQVQRYFATAPGEPVVDNAAEADVKGLEVDLAAHPMPGVGVDIGFAYLDATFASYRTINPDAADPTEEFDLSGNRLPQAPETAFFAGIEYLAELSRYGSLLLRGELKYQSKIYFDQFNSPGVDQGGFTLFNARIAFASASKTWKLAVWGKNLGDKLYKHNVIRSTPLFGSIDFFAAPRRYGFELIYGF